jgi:hypothetical protein
MKRWLWAGRGELLLVMAHGVIVGLPIWRQMGQEDPPGFEDTLDIARRKVRLQGAIGGPIELQGPRGGFAESGIEGKAPTVEGTKGPDATAFVEQEGAVPMIIHRPIPARGQLDLLKWILPLRQADLFPDVFQLIGEEEDRLRHLGLAGDVAGVGAVEHRFLGEAIDLLDAFVHLLLPVFFGTWSHFIGVPLNGITSYATARIFSREILVPRTIMVFSSARSAIPATAGLGFTFEWGGGR